MKHTPGPWEASGNGIHKKVGSVGVCVAITYGDNKYEDARLVAAAPDLLQSCKEFVRKVECGEARSTRSYAQMKAAIAKAEGVTT